MYIFFLSFSVPDGLPATENTVLSPAYLTPRTGANNMDLASAHPPERVRINARQTLGPGITSSFFINVIISCICILLALPMFSIMFQKFDPLLSVFFTVDYVGYVCHMQGEERGLALQNNCDRLQRNA